MMFKEIFLRLTATVCFQINECFKNVHFLSLYESINYNNKVVRRYFYIQRYAWFGKGLVETVL